MRVAVEQQERDRVSLVQRWRLFLTRNEPLVFKSLGVSSAIGLWELSVRFTNPDSPMVSSPSRIIAASVEYFQSPEFWVDFHTSATEFLWGFGVAAIFGILFGYCTGWFRRLDYFFDPIMNFLYASPRIALAPLLILWLGVGIESKIAIIFLMSFFPIVINTARGVKLADPDLKELARAFNASDLQLFVTIIIPGSVPFIVTGLRIGLGVALIGVVVGEFVAATSGLGFMIQQSASNFEIDRVFVGLIVIGSAGVILTELLHQAEKKVDAWRGN